jgi:hypothetical protein
MDSMRSSYEVSHKMSTFRCQIRSLRFRAPKSFEDRSVVADSHRRPDAYTFNFMHGSGMPISRSAASCPPAPVLLRRSTG